jgi:hypothetical protein
VASQKSIDPASRIDSSVLNGATNAPMLKCAESPFCQAGLLKTGPSRLVQLALQGGVNIDGQDLMRHVTQGGAARPDLVRYLK